jgi:hypothetical protein
MSEEGSTQGGRWAPSAWYSALDPEHLGHVQSRGWDKRDPMDALVEAVKGHVSATRMIGVPAEQLLKLPKEAGDSDGWRGVWQRLGAPADPKDYEFADVQVGEVTNSLVDTLRGAAAGVNMPKPMAAAVAQSVAKWVNDQGESYKAEVASNLQVADEAIRKSWGSNYEAFNYVANRGQEALATRLGERLAPQLEGAMDVLRQAGFGELGREMMRVVGAGLGEDKFIGGSGVPGGRAAMTRDMALARLSELKADKTWVARFTSGDTDALKEMRAINLIIAGDG